MIETMIAFLAFLGGLAAHQTDRLVSQFPHDWELLSRYIIGTLTIMAFTFALIRKFNRYAVRDFVAAYTVSSMAVGLGVGVGRWLDDRNEVNA